MHLVILLWTSLAVGDVTEYVRPLGAKKLDQAAFDAETYGEKKSIKREDGGVHITLPPGEVETGWKTPQAIRLGGDFTILADFEVKKLPKPAQEDGVAIGASIATQNLDQPEATLVRLTEMDGSTVYRSIDKPMNQQNPNQMQMFNQFTGEMMEPAKPTKPARKVFRARGERFQIELKREGSVVRYSVIDEESKLPRYLGQVELGANDIAGVKLFASNRNGGDAIEVILRGLTVQASRVTGLGTEIRTVFGEPVHGEPTSIEEGKLIVGGQPKQPPPKPAPAPAPAPAPGANAAPASTLAATPPAGAPALAPATHTARRGARSGTGSSTSRERLLPLRHRLQHLQGERPPPRSSPKW